MSILPKKINKDEILLILLNEEEEELLYTIVDNENDIVLWTKGSDFLNEEIIAYAFESNAEIYRISADNIDDLEDKIANIWTSFIIKTNKDLKLFRENYSRFLS